MASPVLAWQDAEDHMKQAGQVAYCDIIASQASRTCPLVLALSSMPRPRALGTQLNS